MNKTKRSGRKLLLRGEAIALLTSGQLGHIAGGADVPPASELQPISCPSHHSDVVAPSKKA